MFKKKPNIKALSPLRSSDRRKLADEIITQYAIAVPKDEGLQQQDQAREDGTPTIGTLRNSLIPDGMLYARFTTTTGVDLTQISGTVYAGNHAGEEQRILWIRIEERLIPTVYTLWRHPKLTPLLHTPNVVLQKVRGGADLMTPGIARGPPFPTKAIKNAVVAIASLERPSVPMVVGVCEIDVSALDVVQGAKGHAVRGVHWNGDEIWSWNNGGKSGKDMPESIEGWDDEDGGLGGRFGSIKIDESDESDEQGGVTVAGMGEPEAAEVPDDRNNHVEGEDPPFMEADEASKKSLSTQDIDAAFWSAFLFAAHQARIDHKLDPRHGLNFPIPQSNIISNLVLPYLPIFTPEDASSLQIKKTSWKNARKFIKALDKEKLLRSKDRDGHEVVVLDIDFEDPAITAFVPYRLPKKDTPGADIGGGGGGKAIASSTSTSSSSDSSIGQKLKKLNLYKPKEKLAPIFDRADGGTRNLYLASEFRSLITTYVEAESLISPTNKRLVILNPVLANAVFDGQSSLDREVLAKGSVPRDALIDRVIHSSIPHWVLLRDGETRETVKAKSGTGPLVNITLETRSGNKTVTKVSGVETFHINPHVIAEELQKTCASSTSVGQLVGSSPKNPVQEIMVQGPQKDSVTKALEKRGVERGWIQVLDKTKGKKR